MKFSITSLGLAILIFSALASVVPARAQVDGTQVTSDQATDLARQAVRQGNLPLANVLSTALLQQNPNDPDALLVRAFVLRATGQFDEAL